MADTFQQFRLSLSERQSTLFDAIEPRVRPTREEYLVSIFLGKWQFDHYANTFYYVPALVKAGAPILGQIGRSFLANENGYSRITKTLNAEQALSPTPQQDRPAGWAPTSVDARLPV